MSTTIDQKAYLQKYLGRPAGDKKKKKKKVSKGKGFKIIDDDIDLTKLRALEGDELDILGEGEDAPQIAGIIDERPEEVKKLEQFKTSSKWRVINQDDGFNSKLQIEEIKRDIKEVEKENEIVFGKMYSDSEDEQGNDSDLSPPRKQSENSEKAKNSSKKPQNNSDDDSSPPRRNKQSKRSENYESDQSPPRKHENQRPKDRARKPSRWGEATQSEAKPRHRSPSNSPRRSKKQRTSQSPARKSKRKSPDSDSSMPRKSQKVKQKNYNSDMSPPRNDSSKKRNLSPDSDISPPRKRKQSPDRRSKIDKNDVKDKRKLQQDSDSDLSPPRKNKSSHNERQKSSPRKSRKLSPERNQSKRKHDSDSDLSPPRKHNNRDGKEHRNNKDCRNKYKRSHDSPPPFNKKMARTLDGKMAGLQDATQLRQENEAFRRREEDVFNKMTDEISGRNAQAVSRKAKRETSEDRQKQKDKVERQNELDEKYKKWSKGLKQIEAQEARVQEFLHEASKPLARHRDDRDLEDRLRDVERAGDPMLRYIKDKKRERGELGPEKPAYKGSFPPNRFNIRPGYRWDGVDRSNGYEKKYFDHQSKRKAMEEEAYKWSTEDL